MHSGEVVGLLTLAVHADGTVQVIPRGLFKGDTGLTVERLLTLVQSRHEHLPPPLRKP